MRCRRNLAPQSALVPAQTRSMVDETLQICISSPPTRRNERGNRSLLLVPVHPYGGCFAKQGIQAEGPCRCCRRRQGPSLRSVIRYGQGRLWSAYHPCSDARTHRKRNSCRVRFPSCDTAHRPRPCRCCRRDRGDRRTRRLRSAIPAACRRWASITPYSRN